MKKRKRQPNAGKPAISDFLFELGSIKRLPRSGWLTVGIQNPETVAEHVYRTAVIGMLLAREEGACEFKVVRMCLLHDLHEGRTADLHTAARRYAKIDVKKTTGEIFSDKKFEFGREFFELCGEFENGKTTEAIVARDADRLECLVQAKEYLDLGNKYAADWIMGAGKLLKTKTAKEWAKGIAKRDSNAWLLKIRE
ncbi:MAG: HD domain-containing protein [Candidatus Micrarchaeota archaeon]|nr:HD domain-containing protein [Candidatus Micrarchaeota archaeon]